MCIRDRSGYDASTSEGRAAAVHASVLHELDIFLNSHVKRGLMKATLIRVPKGTEEEERAKMNTRFRRLMGGRGRRQVTVQMDDVSVQELGEGLKELSNNTIELAQFQHMMTSLGIPHGLMASGQTNAKATAEEDTKNFYDTTVAPRAIFVQEEVNEELMIPQGYRFVFNFDRLDVRKKRLLEEAQAWQTLINGKQLVSTQYARTIMGVTVVS